MYYFARSPLVCLIFCITYSIFAVMAIISAVILFYCAQETFFASEASEQGMSYDEAFMYCKERKKSIPLPRDVNEEEDVIYKIKHSAAGKCLHVFFAWQADAGNRYQSVNLSTKVAYDTLKVDKEAGIPTSNREWYEIKIEKDLPVVIRGNQPNTSTSGKNVFYFSTYGGADSCLKNRYSCIYVKPGGGSDLVSNFESTIKADKQVYAILLIDNKVTPTSFRVINPTSATGVALAAKYTLNYQYGDIHLMFVSSRFSVVDPDYNCMAYETTSGKVVTHPCDGPACVLCT